MKSLGSQSKIYSEKQFLYFQIRSVSATNIWFSFDESGSRTFLEKILGGHPEYNLNYADLFGF
jgi:hypothetical protein